jgi:hypothetical protein
MPHMKVRSRVQGMLVSDESSAMGSTIVVVVIKVRPMKEIQRNSGADCGITSLEQCPSCDAYGLSAHSPESFGLVASESATPLRTEITERNTQIDGNVEPDRRELSIAVVVNVMSCLWRVRLFSPNARLSTRSIRAAVPSFQSGAGSS